MKRCAKIWMGALTALTISNASATVGVAVGASTFDKDGLPNLGPNEQVKVFLCHVKNSKMSAQDAEICALNKCKTAFNVPEAAKGDKHRVVGGHCLPDGYSDRKGSYVLIYVGDPGDNYYLLSKNIIAPTRKAAVEFVKKDFPIKDKNKVFDFYDDGSNGKD